MDAPAQGIEHLGKGHLPGHQRAAPGPALRDIRHVAAQIQEARFLEDLAHGRNHGPRGGLVGRARDIGAIVFIVDGAAGKHMVPAHELDGLVAAREQDLEIGFRPIHDDGRGGIACFGHGLLHGLLYRSHRHLS